MMHPKIGGGRRTAARQRLLLDGRYLQGPQPVGGRWAGPPAPTVLELVSTIHSLHSPNPVHLIERHSCESFCKSHVACPEVSQLLLVCTQHRWARRPWRSQRAVHAAAQRRLPLPLPQPPQLLQACGVTRLHLPTAAQQRGSGAIGAHTDQSSHPNCWRVHQQTLQLCRLPAQRGWAPGLLAERGPWQSAPAGGRCRRAGHCRIPCPQTPHLPNTPLQKFQLMLLNLNLGGGALRVLCQLILHRLGLGSSWALQHTWHHSWQCEVHPHTTVHRHPAAAPLVLLVLPPLVHTCRRAASSVAACARCLSPRSWCCRLLPLAASRAMAACASACTAAACSRAAASITPSSLLCSCCRLCTHSVRRATSACRGATPAARAASAAWMLSALACKRGMRRAGTSINAPSTP